MPLGIYISVPFCRTKCSYCNFASDVFSKSLFEKYIDRACADIRNALQSAEQMGGGSFPSVVDSIYFGGGTPTVLAAAQIERVFGALRQQFDVSPDAEISVECAPGTLNDEMLKTLLRCGINRISLGTQSFVDQEAAAVGRLHKRESVLDEIARLRSAGIKNINIDLIAGLPHQTPESWEFSLAQAVASRVPHVSVYMLEVDEDSRLGRELIAGGTRYHAHFVPGEEAVADFYVSACERIESAGIAQYEISNFARNGFESRHNLKYWTRQPYLGFGVDAHSMLQTGRNNQALRFSTTDSLEKYVAGAPLQPSRVSRGMALEETFFLGLRLNRGVDLGCVAREFGDDALASVEQTTGELVASGLLESAGQWVRLTPKGRLLSNEVFERFIDLAEIADIERSTAGL